MRKVILIGAIILANIALVRAQQSGVNSVDRLEVLDSVPLLDIKQTSGFSKIFRDWGFVGNSLTSGEHEYLKEDGSKGYLDLYEYSWGQFICNETGAKGVNFSKGGLTCRSWINQMWEKAKEDPKQAYIISLGTNDRYKKYTVGDITTDIDTTDYNKNPDTFAGNFAGIIQRLQSIQPKAKFFLMTMPQTTDKGYNERVEVYNNVIRQMPEYFDNVYLIDIFKYAPVHTDAFKEQYKNGGHMNAAGYLYNSWILMTYIDWIVRNNFKEFAEVALIKENKSIYD
ncbi:MAG: SGNH/GDSL hydrolase family protein [Bacteroidota bacterium]|nr:SGNH/GDSL hydrolase family protein [Bacteroidota bacterium]